MTIFSMDAIRQIESECTSSAAKHPSLFDLFKRSFGNLTDEENERLVEKSRKMTVDHLKIKHKK